MSEYWYYFQQEGVTAAVILPFDLDSVIDKWSRLRNKMVRYMPSAFTRDEWAYMIMSLERDNLLRPFRKTFGHRIDTAKNPLNFFAKTRGEIALWLPNNVSLIGPLMMILVSLTGNPLLMKGGTRSENLTGIFRDYALTHLENGDLRAYLENQTAINCFSRDDPRNFTMSQVASVRIAFSSDETAASIEAMSHPTGSIGIYFTDKRSEAWVESEALTDQGVDTLIKVFAVFGQAGCTSPRRVVIIGGDASSARELQCRILARWPKVVDYTVRPYTASENIMARQWAAALGWDSELTINNAAVVATGDLSLPEFQSHMTLPIVWASIELAVSELPSNIQTIGHIVKDAKESKWLKSISKTNIKRFVPIKNMHDFGPVWDGYGFWRQLFEEIEVSI